MNTRLLKRLIIGIELVIFGGIVVYAPLIVGFGAIYPDASLWIKVWKEFLMGICFVLLVIYVTRQHRWKEMLCDRVVQLAGAYAALHIVLLAWHWQGIGAAFAGLLIDLRYVLFFVLVFVTLKLFPTYRRLFVIVAAVGAAVVSGFALLQVTVLPADVLKYIGYSASTIMPYLTVDLNQDYIRINSTLRGPNPLGAYAGACLAIVLSYVLSHRAAVKKNSRAIFVVALIAVGSMAGVWASYSRSALVAAIGMLLIVAGAYTLKSTAKTRWILGVVAVIIVVIGGLVLSRNGGFVSNVIMHENPSGGSVHKSDDGHVSSLQDGSNRLSRQPLGGGIGSTGSASLMGDSPVIIENQYLSVAHETGWLGLGLFVALSGFVLLRLWRRRADWLALGVFASGVGLMAIGLLLPVWVDDTVSIVWWGLAAIALGGSYGKKRTNH
jgi:hypothetical protein